MRRSFALATGLGAACALLFVPAAIALPPANDAFANAIALSGDAGIQAGTNIQATAEVGEPNHVGRAAVVSVWYTWMPAVDGIASFDTCDATFDTRVAVYTGSTVSGLTEVASSDDSDDCGTASLRSSLDFVADKDVTYHVAVDGFVFQTGSFTLRWKRMPLPPTNVTRPVVTGSSHETETLIVGPGEWSSALPVGYAYR